MTLGLAERQGDLLDDLTRFCDETVAEHSIYGFLHRERDALFPDELFSDLFQDVGRRSIPPSIVATVMVLQRVEGCSDREACDRLAFDARWRYAAGLGGWDEGLGTFVHTVLVDTRARLRRSERPNRVLDVTVETARAAGLVGTRRVLDSTALYDAVATMDTVTLVRSAIRALLAKAPPELEAEIRQVLCRDDDYATPGKPPCDWQDPAAREALIDALAKDAMAALAVLDGRTLDPEMAEAAELLAAVVGQDLDRDHTDGVFRIARRVAPDRIISTVDPQARHGHKTQARGFDGYKGHVSIDPDSEIIVSTAVTAGNVGDSQVAAELLSEMLGPEAPLASEEPVTMDGLGPGEEPAASAPAEAPVTEEPARGADAGEPLPAEVAPDPEPVPTRVSVYGDAAYGTGDFLARLEAAGILPMVKVQPPVAPSGHFPKDRFTIDLVAGTVTCPAEHTALLRRHTNGEAVASFGPSCAACPLAPQCTSSPKGRVIRVSAREAELARARDRQKDPRWKQDYQATRPKVERKIAHLMRRRHGGRRARVRGVIRVAGDFALLGAAVNLARLAALGASSAKAGGWAVAVT
ncbi:MAG TPA: transposase [Actinomycetota bacterium]|nr:transposase [Actinomycetota bacterium]